MSQPSPIMRNMQIGNISVEQIATSLGAKPDHLVEALEEIYTPEAPEQDLENQEESPQWLSKSYQPEDYYVDLESSSSFSKHFNDVCVIQVGQQAQCFLW